MQGKKKRDTANREAAQREEANENHEPTAIDNSIEEGGSVDLLSSKDEDVIF